MENTEDKKHDDEETSYARIEPYTNPAGGWGALLSVARNLKRQEVFKKGAITLLNINQPTGFDCPGCAWPEKKDAHAFNFCENGAKAVAFEATSKRVTPDFFATHTVSWLSEQSDFLLEDSGRLTDPMRYDSATDKYVPISWDDASQRFALMCNEMPKSIRLRISEIVDDESPVNDPTIFQYVRMADQSFHIPNLVNIQNTLKL